jgi:hypothetical protein
MTSTAPFGRASDNGVDVGQGKAEGLGDPGVDHFPFDDVETQP